MESEAQGQQVGDSIDKRSWRKRLGVTAASLFTVVLGYTGPFIILDGARSFWDLASTAKAAVVVLAVVGIAVFLAISRVRWPLWLLMGLALFVGFVGGCARLWQIQLEYHRVVYGQMLQEYKAKTENPDTGTEQPEPAAE